MTKDHIPVSFDDSQLKANWRKRRLFAQHHVEAAALLHEIVRTADCLREARALDGGRALYFGARWQLLRAVERCGGEPTFSELARSLKISRQTARENALKAAQAGVVELSPSPDDRRAWQVALTPAGRRELEAERLPQFAWVSMLLNGIELETMRATEHALRVIRLRLERYASEARAQP